MKTVPTLRVVSTTDTVEQARQMGVELPTEMQVTLANIGVVAREGLLAMSVAAGMAVMQTLFDAEIAAVCGPKSRHDAERTASRHGRENGSVVLGGRRVPVTRPRARTVGGHEVPLTTYALFAGEDQLSKVVLERMLAGLATRRHPAAAEPVGEAVEGTATATSRSAISRRFVVATKTALAELLARDLGPLDIKVLMVDGEHIADHCCVVALAITADGTKVPVGLWEGSTENKTVAKHLLADLVSRGLNTDDGLLVVIDGAKALSAAVTEVFGAKAAIQRCTVHKRRNVGQHLPESERNWVDVKLVRALNNPDAAAGLRDAKALATALERKHPGAAASLREGLPELFTVARLGITGTLATTLTSTNPIESMISIARTTNRNVTRWRDGQMVLRWTAAGMINAQRSFRRVKGYKQMPQLVAALRRHAHPATPRTTGTVGTAA
ncbi:MAG TPA: IS256 family transposase [Mycobacterium sp.]|nr:IS256 family transposase [Mycobacterium sp.]